MWKVKAFNRWLRRGKVNKLSAQLIGVARNIVNEGRIVSLRMTNEKHATFWIDMQAKQAKELGEELIRLSRI